MLRILILLCIVLPSAACRTRRITGSALLTPVLVPYESAELMRKLTTGYFEVPPDLAAAMNSRVFEVISIEGDDVLLGCGAAIWHGGKLHLITCAHAVMTDPTEEQIVAARRSDFALLNQTRARASLWAKDCQGNTFPLKLIRWKRQFDLALLEIVEKHARVLPETITRNVGHVDVDASIYIAGFRSELGRRVIRTKVERQLAGIRVNDGVFVLNVYRTYQPIFHGFSGGPVFADDRETLIGINVAKRDNESFLSSPANIASLLSEK